MKIVVKKFEKSTKVINNVMKSKTEFDSLAEAKQFIYDVINRSDASKADNDVIDIFCVEDNGKELAKIANATYETMKKNGLTYGYSYYSRDFFGVNNFSETFGYKACGIKY